MNYPPGFAVQSRRSSPELRKAACCWICGLCFQSRMPPSQRLSIASSHDRLASKQALALLYTVGHSTRSLDDLIETLQAHSIQTVVDIRAFPMSRRLPQFNRESLEKSLPVAGIHYVWMKALGGYRKKSREDSPNTGLRNASFRNYADYMLT